VLLGIEGTRVTMRTSTVLVLITVAHLPPMCEAKERKAENIVGQRNM